MSDQSRAATTIRVGALAMVLVAVAVVTLSSLAAAAPDAAKQRVAISAKNLSNGQFVLTPLQSGALKPDSGSARIVYSNAGGAMRQGQSISLYDTTFTYKGRRGTLTIQERIEWVDVSNENARGFDFRPGVAFGTWKVVRGTGQYARIVGGGRTAHAGMGQEWFARQEGFLSRR
ncbi:MAG TPA: hypothetical protein VLA69_05575 [Gaiellaceae bacterium]|nr:hypothetical protein [Gaiellaceae bacterium]